MPWTPRAKKVKLSDTQELPQATQEWPTSDDDMEDLSEVSDPDDEECLEDGVDEVLAAIAELRELLLKLLTKPSAASAN